MSSTHLQKISERSGNVNLFNFRFKVASNKTIFSTFYYTLAVYPKIRFSHFGCFGRNTLYYTLAIQELKTITSASLIWYFTSKASTSSHDEKWNIFLELNKVWWALKLVIILINCILSKTAPLNHMITLRDLHKSCLTYVFFAKKKGFECVYDYVVTL